MFNSNPNPTTSEADTKASPSSLLQSFSSSNLFSANNAVGESTVDIMNRQLSPWLFASNLKLPTANSPSFPSALDSNLLVASPLNGNGINPLSPNTMNMLLGSTLVPTQQLSQQPQQQMMPSSQMDNIDTMKKAAQVSLNLFHISNRNNGQHKPSQENRLFAPVFDQNTTTSTSVVVPSPTNFDSSLQLPSSVGWFSRTLSSSSSSGDTAMTIMHSPLPALQTHSPALPQHLPLPANSTHTIVNTKKRSASSSNGNTSAPKQPRKATSTAGDSEDNEPKITSRHRGVCWYKRTKKWVVQTKVNGKRVHVGYFDDEEKAAEAYRNTVAGIQRNKMNSNNNTAAAAAATNETDGEKGGGGDGISEEIAV